MNYNDLIPTELRDELIAIRDSYTKDNFRIGDIVGIVTKICDNKGLQILREDIYKAVGCYVGKAARSVREYYMIAQIYPEPIRQRFEVLSFDHFRNAAQLGHGKDIAALEWAVGQVEQLGRPATVEGMLVKFAAVPSPDVVYSEAGDGDGESDGGTIPEAVEIAQRPVRTIFGQAVMSIKAIVESRKINLAYKTYQEVMGAIGVLERALNELEAKQP